jgi:hypothetical protein
VQHLPAALDRLAEADGGDLDTRGLRTRRPWSFADAHLISISLRADRLVQASG